MMEGKCGVINILRKHALDEIGSVVFGVGVKVPFVQRLEMRVDDVFVEVLFGHSFVAVV